MTEIVPIQGSESNPGFLAAKSVAGFTFLMIFLFTQPLGYAAQRAGYHGFANAIGKLTVFTGCIALATPFAVLFLFKA